MASNRKSKKSSSSTAQSESQPSMTPVEMTTLAWQLRKEMTAVTEAVAEMKQFQGFLSEQLDKLQQDLKQLTKEQQESQRRARHTVEHLEAELERGKRAKNVMIFGYPSRPKEDTVRIVRQIASVLGCQLPREAIEEARRLPGERSPPIRVVFGAERYKRELLESAKKIGQPLLRKVDSTFEGNWRIFVRDDVPKNELMKYPGSINSLCSK